MEKTPTDKLAVSMALDALSEAVEETRQHEDALKLSRAVRDDLIRNAYDSDVSVLRLVRITKLSREQIYNITRKG